MPIVADKVDGKKLNGCIPYYFVVKTRQGGESTLRDVKQITVKASLDWFFALGKLAGGTGLEPATSCVTGRRSNQLNYSSKTN
jgi:hypothetical protein